MNERNFIKYPHLTTPKKSLIMTGFNTHPEYQKSEKPNFTGHGPKGYKRSDERIYEDVCETLFHEPQIDASEIEVSVKEGIVTLTGVTKDRETKRKIEDLTHDCLGVQQVYNQIHVRPDVDPKTRMYTP